MGSETEKVRKKHPKIKKQDKIIVIAGKEKGKIGTVLKVDYDKMRLIAEKINMVKKHARPSAKNAQGGIIEKEASIHFSNVMIICNKCAEPARIGKRILEDGSSVRVCRKCNESIDE
ncbi:MAG TPA: 50S ribosomal protein L24 [Desulfobacteraceae bacterium]|nr:50S ribosomal protein L24 [Desulfobacteraceae bacterium]HPJ66709.1 50S ribosomal protein L24 [Desulfobacteraceae bacterium]HPQ26930.1 50S ribosomal protein L24 [Desulfobacteraceae bacterium]